MPAVSITNTKGLVPCLGCARFEYDHQNSI